MGVSIIISLNGPCNLSDPDTQAIANGLSDFVKDKLVQTPSGSTSREDYIVQITNVR